MMSLTNPNQNMRFDVEIRAYYAQGNEYNSTLYMYILLELPKLQELSQPNVLWCRIIELF